MPGPILYDPSQYRACSICRCGLGERCYSRSGRIVNGLADGVATYLEMPHKGRQRRTKRSAYTSAKLAR